MPTSTLPSQLDSKQEMTSGLNKNSERNLNVAELLFGYIWVTDTHISHSLQKNNLYLQTQYITNRHSPEQLKKRVGAGELYYNYI